MTIEVIANHNELENVNIQITSTMPLRHWKVIHESLKKSLKDNYHGVTASFMWNLDDAIKNYTEKVENKIEINN